ncbi:sensor histidine kinase [Rugamonas sp. CCM 8940]|uniref:sensor histidine kinase n=1 Tax=Rugamonas sp. CCM 8940 TaxID=2765359 RepID=UPI0018F77DB7|nr:histidine kinase [Rugamonas sp. CCM 8940]MBJ7310447.1 histidine kinase [Rugamonas sp. CCM 8940]
MTPHARSVGAAPSGPAALLREVAGFSRGQAAVSLLLVVALTALSLHRHAYTWAALFGALLLPLGITAGVLRALEYLLRGPRAWFWLWPMLLLILSLSSLLCAAGYRAGLAGLGLRGMALPQVFSSALGFGLLTLALPLWIAQSQARALHLAQLTQSALTADLKALQAQIEPHFLYNTLANTRYLARHEPARAVQMLDHLIAYLHSALPDLRRPMSSLGREFELAQHYLALMAIRFGERLRFELDCPAALGAAQLPPLLLMPLVENAVQHGVEPRSGDVEVRLLALLDGARLRLTVRDNGAGLVSVVLGSGVGLHNLRQRLAALYGADAAFALRIGADGWTEAELTIPYITTTTDPA